MLIDRKELLRQLDSVWAGVASREIIEQSTCFVFENKKVITFNDEVACTQECDLDITAAVPAAPLINILRKLEESELRITVEKGSLRIRGRGQRASINLEQEILLPTEGIEEPEKWKGLPSKFMDALKFVESCASTDEEKFVMCCIRITPDCMETCDREQVARYSFKTKIKRTTIVRRDSLIKIANLDMISFSETDNWIHFKNQSGLVMSCRRFFEEGQNLDDLFEVKGIKIKLPKGIQITIDKAEVFSADTTDENKLRVTLTSGKFIIEGRGMYGKYVKTKKFKYNGKVRVFELSATLLLQLVSKYTECRVGKGHIKVTGKNFVYVTATTIIKKKKGKK